MLIGQSVVGVTTPGIVYYGPWFPRQGNALRVVLEVINASGAFSLACAVETKNSEDADSPAPSVIGTATAAAIGIATADCTGCLELVRYKFTAIATSGSQWIHFRPDAPLWLPN